MHFIFGLAVNHHLNEMEVAQFEHFIMKNARCGYIFFRNSGEHGKK